MIGTMNRFLAVPAVLLVLALVFPGAVLGGHACCHAGHPCARCTGLPPFGGTCGETSVEHGCHCRVAPAQPSPAPGNDIPTASSSAASPPGPLPPVPGTARAPMAAPAPRATFPGRAGPGEPVFLATGRFLS